MNRSNRQRIARETVDILEEGSYTAPSGKTIDISNALDKAIGETRLFEPEELEKMTVRRDFGQGEATRSLPRIEVSNETTLSAARRMHRQHPEADLVALNFASAKNPGGGFLSGASAQEESLARKSGLYACLKEVPAYYQRNKKYGSSLYTDHMIYSPGVPVFRDADDQLLEQPYTAGIITAPAVNADAVRQNEPRRENMIQPVMEQRIEKLIALCVYLQHTRLVLGAWGCGVFGNDPSNVARWFARYLTGDSPYARHFNQVMFAVLDETSERRIIQPFENHFS